MCDVLFYVGTEEYYGCFLIFWFSVSMSLRVWSPFIFGRALEQVLGGSVFVDDMETF